MGQQRFPEHRVGQISLSAHTQEVLEKRCQHRFGVGTSRHIVCLNALTAAGTEQTEQAEADQRQ
jgi:hypothetical protein